MPDSVVDAAADATQVALPLQQLHVLKPIHVTMDAAEAVVFLLECSTATRAETLVQLQSTTVADVQLQQRHAILVVTQVVDVVLSC